jgi:DNA-binding PadR family transcriptional regulator
MVNIDVDIDVDMMFRHWQRHTASVPKGFLRNTMLRMLSEQDMSGSEIMSAIKKETQGRWIPSPGSVYPLLAWLEDKGFIKEAQKTKGEVKRYTLTEQGKNFLKEVKEKKMEFPEPSFMMPPFIGLGGWYAPSKEDIQIRNSIGRFFLANINFRKIVGTNLSKEKYEQVIKTIDDASEKIEEINRKIAGEKNVQKGKD